MITRRVLVQTTQLLHQGFSGRLFKPASFNSKTARPKIIGKFEFKDPHTSSKSRTKQTFSTSATNNATMSSSLTVERVPCLSDNYSWLIHEPTQNITAVVDPAEVEPIIAALGNRKLDYILNTHHHWDHTGGNEALKSQYNCTIIGPKADAKRIPGIDIELSDGDTYKLGAAEFICYDTPGHTSGHVTFFFPQAAALFPGDTLFSLGCGRLFEGTPAQMWTSLSKLKILPPHTKIYCAHEYTQSNARFALSIDGDNRDLVDFAAEIDQKRRNGEPTVPSVLEKELKCNPFLRPDSIAIRKVLGVPVDADNAIAFGAIRKAKDIF